MFDSVDLRRPVFGALVFHRGASGGGVGRAVIDFFKLAQHDNDFDLVLDHHLPKGADGFLLWPLGGDVLFFANPRRINIGRIAQLHARSFEWQNVAVTIFLHEFLTLSFSLVQKYFKISEAKKNLV